MKRVLVAAALVAGVTAAAPADAADVWPGPTPFAAYRWAGPYVGANLGYEWGTFTNSPLNPGGFAGGIQGGYNWQSSQFVFGVETDLQFSGASDTFGAARFSNPWFGTLRGRGGVAMNNVLLYLTAGLGYGGGKLEIAGASETQTHVGGTIGAGAEYAFTPGWSAKAEYLYMDLGSRTYVLTGVSSSIQASLFRFGIDYHF
jgi:outer membrane immunogenic protein